MFERDVHFANISLSVDPIDQPRTEENDNVMAIFYEEQPLMWEFTREAIGDTVRRCPGEIDFLDVGTGSGVWSILICKSIGAKHVIAIDKSSRAIQMAQKNAERNGVSFELRHEFYNMNSALHASAKVIGLYAPYHLYPPEVEMTVPQHARGGIDGQQIFREQLCTADYHLANDGIIVFNQMCLGKNDRPAFLDYIPQLIRGSSITYTNIFEPINTEDFLKSVYENEFPDYQKSISCKYPQLFFCDGIIRRDGEGVSKEVQHGIDLQGRSWKDRIEAHRELAKHSKNHRKR